MDTTWGDEEGHDAIDYAALGLIVCALAICGLLAFGGLVAPFIVAREYADDNFIAALIAATIGALIAVYLLMTWVSVEQVRSAVALIVLFAGMAYLAASTGLPATLGSVQGKTETLVFEVTGVQIAGRRRCAGLHVRHPEFVDATLCHLRGEPGIHVELTGRRSVFGLAYREKRVLP